MPTEPVVEQIAQKIVERCQQVTESNGYWQTTSGVVRPQTIEQKIDPRDLRIAVMQDDADDNEDLTTAGNGYAQAFDQPFLLVLFVLPSDKSEIPIDTRVNRFVSDVRKAVGQPVDTWQNFDGLSVNASLGPTNLFDSVDGKYTGAIFDVTVSYRTPENDPYTAR